MKHSVPFDIWYHIANFLPADHLKTLFPVNHAFFNFGMNERYKSIKIDVTLDHSKTSGKLAWLQCSPHLHRVRSLTLNPQHRRISYEAQLQQALIKVNSQNSEIADVVSHIICNMLNVQELSIRGECWLKPVHSDDIIRFLQPVMATGWNTFGTTLRQLTLHLSVDQYYHVLTPTLVFPALQKLELVLIEECKTRDVSKLFSDLLVPFITNHHCTLEYLNLKLSRCGPLDVSGIAKMSCLPRLRTLAFHRSDVDTSWLHHILRLHSNGLREVILSFDRYCFNPHISSSQWYAQHIFHPPLPHVESLDLGRGCFMDMGLTGAYIKGFKGLMTLSLDSGRPFHYKQVSILVEAMSACDGLRTLTLNIVSLTLRFLDLLARTLPNLDSLTLTCHRICHPYFQKCSDEHGIQSFFRAMAQEGRLYCGWKLAHLHLNVPNIGASLSTRILPQLKGAISDACPGLKTFTVR